MRFFVIFFLSIINVFNINAQCTVTIVPNPAVVCPSHTVQLTVNVSGNFLKNKFR